MPYRAESIFEAVEHAVRVFGLLGQVLTDRLGYSPQVASSYGFAAPWSDPAAILDVLTEAIDRAGCADTMALALDCASSAMYDRASGTYELLGERVDSKALVDYALALSEKYPLLFVEDLLDEDDWDGYVRAVAEIPRTIILGDDLIVTNPKRLARAAQTHAVDGFILKPNQVGTISEALDAHAFAEQHGLLSIPSGRSGGVIDDFVMDLSVGLQVPFQKTGAPRSGERVEKLNFLMRAAEQIPRIADVPALARF